MQFPIFQLSPADLSALWAIANRYPQALGKRYGLTFKVFGFSAHPSVGVRGLLVDLFGAPSV